MNAFDVTNQDILKSIDIFRKEQRASTSCLQRSMRISYTRAARIMDVLELRGLIGPPRGQDPRELFLDKSKESTEK